MRSIRLIGKWLQILPAIKYPKANWIMPASKTVNKNESKEPNSVIAVKTIAVNPAAGPEMLIWTNSNSQQ